MRTKAEIAALEEANGSPSGSDSAHSFLTESQRAALDAALAAKQTAPVQVPSATRSPSSASRELSRANSSGTRSPSKTLKSAGSGSAELSGHTHHKSSQSRKGTGKAKKGGAGGKFTWGSSYDNVLAILEEYYVNGDIQDAATTLQARHIASGIFVVHTGCEIAQELGEPPFHHFFVKKVVTLAMDKNDREHEMAANLLSSLYHEIIQADQMQKGFKSLLNSVDDLKLDVPSAEDDLALFLARAVIDDILPPAFMHKIHCAAGSSASSVKSKAELHLTARRPAERLLRAWGGTDRLTLEHTKESISKCLQACFFSFFPLFFPFSGVATDNTATEYVSSSNVSEARHCLHKLAVPFFHHEVVKQALLRMMEDEQTQPALVQLLRQLSSSGDLRDSQISRGFQRVSLNLEDTCLDTPQAKDIFQKQVASAMGDGWLDADWAATPSGVLASSASSPANGSPSRSETEAVSYKAAAVATVKEYLSSSDMQEVVSSLTELQQPHLAHIFVKQAVQIGMDRKDRERELVSALLSNLYPSSISQEEMAKGFTRLLLFTEDLQLDNPDAAHLLSLFLGRAIVDEAVPPSFLAAVLPTLEDHSEGVNVVQSTGTEALRIYLTAAWLQALLAEYLTNGDILEASRCLMELNVPYYHHELVKRALVMAADDSKGHNSPLLLKLLSELASSGAINQTQMRKGFQRVEESLDDISLDSPLLKPAFAKYKQQAELQGWLI
ncbi:MAG: hypothetical protein FRX49_09213 [Trebouxia sp. A1-2]|nr:MAG: hypothetical protein FRX49_09213 [Trebouxia sp. A1-2]